MKTILILSMVFAGLIGCKHPGEPRIYRMPYPFIISDSVASMFSADICAEIIYVDTITATHQDTAIIPLYNNDTLIIHFSTEDLTVIIIPQKCAEKEVIKYIEKKVVEYVDFPERKVMSDIVLFEYINLETREEWFEMSFRNDSLSDGIRIDIINDLFEVINDSNPNQVMFHTEYGWYELKKY